MAKSKYFRVYILNVNAIHQHCGYGEGLTHGEAVLAALARARECDKDAKYYKPDNMVHVHYPVLL